MADPRHSRLMAEMFVEMLHEEDQTVLSPDSEYKISDADDLCSTESIWSCECKSSSPRSRRLI